MELPSNAAPAVPRATHPWINRNFGLLWSGQAISFIGDFIFDTTLILWVATKLASGQSWAPAAVSGVLISIFLPTLVGGPFAGVFVDRWDKRRTMLAMDLARAALIGILLLSSGIVPLPFIGSGPTVGVQLGAIYAIVAMCTLCQQFFGPSRMALIGDLVHPDDQGRASGSFEATMALAGIIGPPLAGPLLFTFGVQWALGINAASFLVSFAAILLVAAPPAARSVAAGEKGNALREFRAGLSFFFRNRILTTLIITLLIATLGAGAINSLDVFFALQNLHASPQLYGVLSAAFGAGAVVGSIAATVLIQRIGPHRFFWFGMLAGGTGIFIYSRLASFLPAVILLAFVAIPIAGVNVALMPLVLQTTPRDMIGRVNAVLMPVVSLGSIASIVLAGLLVSTWLSSLHATVLGLTFGPVDTIFSATGILCVLAGVYAMLNLRGQLPVPNESAPEEPTSEQAGPNPAVPDIAS